MEDASDDEEVVVSDTQVTEPILLITIEECSPHTTTEVNIEEPQLTKDPPIRQRLFRTAHLGRERISHDFLYRPRQQDSTAVSPMTGHRFVGVLALHRVEC